jgi:CRP-like cAMP-binding protein
MTAVKKSQIDAAWSGQAECHGCSIRDLALFADLQASDFSLIHLPIDEIKLSTGSAVYHAADEGSAVFTLRSGLIKLVQYLADGSQRIVRLLRPGDTLGLEVLVGHPYEHSAVVLRPALLCRIPIEVVNRLSVETPRLHSQLMKRWHQSVRQADEWLTELSTGNAKARVARLLLTLSAADQGFRDHARPTCPSSPSGETKDTAQCELFSREDVGAMLGVTTETASRTIAEFRRQGVLTDLQQNLYCCDVVALRRIAGEL